MDCDEISFSKDYAYLQKDNFPRVIRKTRFEVERVLDRKLSLGERMLLHDFARTSLKDLLDLFVEGFDERNSFAVFQEATYRFLREYCPLELHKY